MFNKASDPRDLEKHSCTQVESLGQGWGGGDRKWSLSTFLPWEH